MQANKRHPLKGFSLDALFRAYSADNPSVADFVNQLRGALRSRDWEKLSLLFDAAHPLKFGCAVDYLQVAQAVAFLKKNESYGLEETKRTTAIKKFLAAEKVCASINYKFGRMYDQGTFSPECRIILSRARDRISRLLGPLDDSAKMSISRLCRHGPGVVKGGKSRETDEAYKNIRPLGFTREAIKVWQTLPWHHPLLFGTETVVMTSSKLDFVPKTLSTHRSICIEPGGNMFLQLGIGEYMSKRLKSHAGIDLRSQLSNQQAAILGSMTDDLATIDLTAASDSISIGLVSYLVDDPDWFDLLWATRTPRYSVDNCEYAFQKWSSMGNGYTFPLETIIFWAIACEVSRAMGEGTDRVLAYGDDIVIPSSCALPLIEMLREVGFAINSDKSYWYGPFRESCGFDVWNGIDVRPLFITELPRSLADFHHLLNTILLIGSKGLGWTNMFKYVWGLLDPKSILTGPITESTRSHVWVPHNWVPWSFSTSLQSKKYETLVEIPVDYTRLFLTKEPEALEYLTVASLYRMEETRPCFMWLYRCIGSEFHLYWPCPPDLVPKVLHTTELSYTSGYVSARSCARARVIKSTLMDEGHYGNFHLSDNDLQLMLYELKVA